MSRLGGESGRLECRVLTLRLLFAVGGGDELTAPEAIPAAPIPNGMADAGESFKGFRIRTKLPLFVAKTPGGSVTRGATRGWTTARARKSLSSTRRPQMPDLSALRARIGQLGKQTKRAGVFLVGIFIF
jgi:hypothetical protein